MPSTIHQPPLPLEYYAISSLLPSGWRDYYLLPEKGFSVPQGFGSEICPPPTPCHGCLRPEHTSVQYCRRAIVAVVPKPFLMQRFSAALGEASFLLPFFLGCDSGAAAIVMMTNTVEWGLYLWYFKEKSKTCLFLGQAMQLKECLLEKPLLELLVLILTFRRQKCKWVFKSLYLIQGN